MKWFELFEFTLKNQGSPNDLIDLIQFTLAKVKRFFGKKRLRMTFKGIFVLILSPDFMKSVEGLKNRLGYHSQEG